MTSSAASDPGLPKRRQSLGEEIANAISHGIGLLAGVIATPILIAEALLQKSAVMVGASVFAVTVVILYLTSTLYHALPHGRWKRIFRILDHGAIFLLIAGTYTPFTLGVLRGAWGWTLFGVIWGLAATGIVFKAIFGVRHSVLSTIVYVAMGWLVIVAAQPLLERMPPWGLFWLLAGGLAYSLGVIFFAADRLRYGHFVWHLFVLARYRVSLRRGAALRGVISVRPDIAAWTTATIDRGGCRCPVALRRFYCVIARISSSCPVSCQRMSETGMTPWASTSSKKLGQRELVAELTGLALRDQPLDQVLAGDVARAVAGLAQVELLLEAEQVEVLAHPAARRPVDVEVARLLHREVVAVDVERAEAAGRPLRRA